MATADVIMPKMGDGMEAGTLLSWKKRDGEEVKDGDIIAEIETDKSNVDIPAEDSGILRTRVSEGQSVPVGSVIATIGDGTGVATTSKPAASATATPAASEPTAAAPAPVQPSAATPKSAARNGSPERIKASPLARRIARELGVTLASLRGSGPNGRIIETDVRSAYKKAPEVSATGSQPSVPSQPAIVPQGIPGELVELSSMRKVIARRMIESKSQMPHFYLTCEVDMEASMALRKQLNSLDDSLQKISLNDFVIKAAALALTKVPDVNRIYQGDRYFQATAANIGIAVALDDGLIVPVVRDADKKSLRSVAKEAKQLADKARARKLQPPEYSGGTFTVSNLGSFDIDNFIAIIDPSQGGILAVGTIRKVPVVMPDDTIAVRQRMNITLSGDHRVMDGAAGARFMQEVKRLLQSPLSLLEP